MQIKMLAAGSFAALTIVGAAAQDVGVSVHVSQPGVYGRVDIGRFPQPQVVVQQPVVVVQRAPVRAEPVYLWVPPGHRRDWKRHCADYRACGVPVYFVQDRWYHEHVLPARDRHEDDHGRGKQKKNKHDKHEDKYEKQHRKFHDKHG